MYQEPLVSCPLIAGHSYNRHSFFADTDYVKEHAKGIGQQFKNTPTVVVAAALFLAVGAFGIGLAAGNSNDSSDSHDQGRDHHGMHGRGFGPGAGPGQQRGLEGRPDDQQLQKFRDCLTKQGVKRPDPGNPPSAGELKKLRSAMQKCNKYLPTPGAQGGGRGYGPPGQGGGVPGGPPGGGPPGFNGQGGSPGGGQY